MEKERYYVYCDGVLGVKTNRTDFRWIYGSNAPEATAEEFEKCAVRLTVRVRPERMLEHDLRLEKRFQSYLWDGKTLHCRRRLCHVPIGYDITLTGSSAQVELGSNYYRLVRHRVMNLHGAYYLLSELANILLLQQGFLTMHAAAVFYKPQDRGAVYFAPPDTGKTRTALELCRLPGYQLVGEDVIISDGQRLFGCPWTGSCRRGGRKLDSAGSVGRRSRPAVTQIRRVCPVTDMTLLSLGNQAGQPDGQEILRQMCLLNGYLFQYHSSPIVKILAYFDEKYHVLWEKKAEQLLAQMAQRCRCGRVQAQHPADFVRLVRLDGWEE